MKKLVATVLDKYPELALEAQKMTLKVFQTNARELIQGKKNEDSLVGLQEKINALQKTFVETGLTEAKDLSPNQFYDLVRAIQKKLTKY